MGNVDIQNSAGAAANPLCPAARVQYSRSRPRGSTRGAPYRAHRIHLRADFWFNVAMSPDVSTPSTQARFEPAFESAVTTACERARDMLRAGATRLEVLTHLATAGEQVAGPDTVVSILVLDNEGLLRNGASPNLPPDYLDAIDRLKPNPNLGTCAAAAATGEIVITPSFYADEKWSELRHLPLALGFQGAWSMPIKAGGRVLGTYGTYYRERREPTPREIAAVKVLAETAAAAIDASR